MGVMEGGRRSGEERRGAAGHWDTVHQSHEETALSWYEADPVRSFEWVRAVAPEPSATIVDVGAGRSRLADRLLGAGYEEITLLDVSGDAIAETRARLGSRAPQVRFVVGDVLDWRPLHRYDVWHDRALFHFLTDPSDRARYVAVLRAAVRVGGHVVIATFAPSGPESCSGLPVVRYDAEGLQRALGTSFRLVRAEEAAHRTPSGGVQPFTWACFQRCA